MSQAWTTYQAQARLRSHNVAHPGATPTNDSWVESELQRLKRQSAVGPVEWRRLNNLAWHVCLRSFG